MSGAPAGAVYTVDAFRKFRLHSADESQAPTVYQPLLFGGTDSTVNLGTVVYETLTLPSVTQAVETTVPLDEEEIVTDKGNLDVRVNAMALLRDADKM